MLRDGDEAIVEVARANPTDGTRMIAALAGSDWTLEFWIRLGSTPAKDVVILEMGPEKTGPHTSLSLCAGGGRFVPRCRRHNE